MTAAHRATRTVRLPDSWDNRPRDVQVNYYNYRAKRLIYSTDVYIGDRLVYRTNAVACRGDDLQPGQPVMLVVGDDLVHGDLSGSFVDQIRIEPCRILNGGIENLPFSQAVDRFNELVALVKPVAGVLALPRRELIPERNRVNQRYEGDWEPAWEVELDRVHRPAVFALLGHARNSPRQDGEDGEPILERFDRFVAAWAKKRDVALIVPGEPEGGLAVLKRRLGIGSKLRPGQDPRAALVEQALAKPVSAYLQAHPSAAAPDAAAPAAADGVGAHGPGDVGRNYPLW
jgi:hypothetical protein